MVSSKITAPITTAEPPIVVAPLSQAAAQITAYRQFLSSFAANESSSTFLGLGLGSFALLGLTEFALPLLETIALTLFAAGGFASLGIAAYKWKRTRPDTTGHDRT